jgi:hypothetical protein
MMKSFSARIVAAVLAASTLAPATQAAPWQSINRRQASLWHRIDQGVRHGGLTRREAHNLRNRFWSLARLEQRYRRHGLTWSERRDLDRRFNALSRSIRVQRHDWQHRRR